MQRAALGALVGAARVSPRRWLSAAPPALRELRELRARTGQPVMRCREALERAGGDLEQAQAWLEAESRRRGWARAAAAPGAGRAREGLVGVLSEGSAAVMVEVNCETDFVARTPDFQQLVEMAARGVLGHCRGASGTKHLLQEDELAQLRAGDGGDLLSDHLALAMGRLGERLALRRAGWLRAPGGFVATYAHGWVPPGPPVAMGTYGALVACGGPAPGPPTPELQELGRRVAQHVVGLAPTALGTPEDELGGDTETRLLAQGSLLEPGVPLGRYLRERGGSRCGISCASSAGRSPPRSPVPPQPEGGDTAPPWGHTHCVAPSPRQAGGHPLCILGG